MAEAKADLGSVIKEVARQLREAADSVKQKDPVMRFSECEIELATAIEVKGEAGVKFWVVELGGGKTKETTQSVKLKFTSIEGKPVVFLAGGEGPGPLADIGDEGIKR